MILRFFPSCGSPCLEWVFHFLARPCLFRSYPSQCCPFVPHCGSSVHSLSGLSSEEIIPYAIVYLLCLWEEMSSGSSYNTTLNTLGCIFISFLKQNLTFLDKSRYLIIILCSEKFEDNLDI